MSADGPAPPLELRPATSGDIPVVRALAERIWRGSYAEMLAPAQIDYMLDWMYSPAKIASEISSGVLWHLVLRGETPVGYLAITLADETTAELNKLYLLPDMQGQGFGQWLLGRAVALAAERGRTELRLRVNKTNSRALRAYHRAGFRTVDDLVADIGGGFVMDDYVLARPIGAA